MCAVPTACCVRILSHSQFGMFCVPYKNTWLCGCTKCQRVENNTAICKPWANCQKSMSQYSDSDSVLQSTSPYYKVLLKVDTVLPRTTKYYFLRTTKYYIVTSTTTYCKVLQFTTPCYKVLLQYYKVLQGTTLSTTRYPALQSTTRPLCSITTALRPIPLHRITSHQITSHHMREHHTTAHYIT